MSERKPRPVQVEWIDSTSLHYGWDEADRYRKETPVVIRTVGLLVAERKDALVIALSHEQAHDKVQDALLIPRGVIRKVRRLR